MMSISNLEGPLKAFSWAIPYSFDVSHGFWWKRTDGFVHSEAESRRGDSGNLLRAGHPNTGRMLQTCEATTDSDPGWGPSSLLRFDRRYPAASGSRRRSCSWAVHETSRWKQGSGHLSFPPQVWQADGRECSMLLSCRSILHLSYSNYSMLLWPFLLSESLFANTSQISQQKRTRIAALNLSTTITW